MQLGSNGQTHQIGTPSDNQGQLAAIEANIAQAREKIAMARALDRLSQNPDFKKVVIEGYFKEEAVRLVHIKSDPHFADKQEQIVRDIDAIGALNRYFSVIDYMARTAEAAIEADESTREELLGEDA